MRKSDKRWISVKDTLPQNGDKVIFGCNNISDEKDRLCKPYVSSGHYMDGFYSERSLQKINANYWMPMPVLLNGF